jgi:hypothetical protein
LDYASATATMPAMADWRQIQARIRKAKNSPDAHAKLSELYQRTHDGMVAWELALIQEKAEVADEAVKWYTVAAERFRRAEWKKKAEEALTRLGAALPAGSAISMDAGVNTEEPLNSVSGVSDEGQVASPLAPGEIHESDDEGASSEAPAKIGSAADSDDPAKKKRRRGRRGGRGRRRKGTGAAPGLPSQAFAETSALSSVVSVRQQAPKVPAPRAPIQERTPATFESPVISHEPPQRDYVEHAAPMLPSERTAHGRAGDPALASRMSHLESMLRRLVGSPLHRLDTEDAPAGPGVFLLSDSDQITSYYVEACQTLRVGVGNLVRGARSSSGKTTRGSRSSFDSGLKAKLAEHLGITEAKVSQYLKDHCVVRWIQMDDDAPHLAHFAIGVLRTPLNLD